MDVSDFRAVSAGPAPTPVPLPAVDTSSPDAAPASPTPAAAAPAGTPPAAPAQGSSTAAAQASSSTPPAAPAAPAGELEQVVEQVVAGELERPSTAPEPERDDKPAEPAKPTKVDPRFSALARKEAQLYREREALKAERAAVEQARQQVAAFEQARQQARLNPVAALEALGLSPVDVNEFILNGNKPTPSAEVQAVRDELERYRAEQAEQAERAERAAAERLAAERNAVLDTFRRTAVDFVEKNPDRYPLTTIHNGATLVPKIVEQHFARTEKLLTTAQAADLVEKHFERVADRVAKARAGQARPDTSKPVAAPSPAAPVATTPTPAQPRTLSNALTASTSSPAPARRTDEDRIRAALARLEGR